MKLWKASGGIFKFAVVVGLLLGIALLAQTIETYIFVSRSLARQEANREAGRRFRALEQMLRGAGAQDTARLAESAAELQRESGELLAWVRILNTDGKTLAQSGGAGQELFSADRIHNSFTAREDMSQTVDTPNGKVLAIARILRLRQPPPPPENAVPPPSITPREARPQPVVAEVAVYLNRINAPFGHLQVSAVVGCSAAIALVTAMIVIGLRFGNYLRARQLAQELELARSVQLALLPHGKAPRPDLDFAGECLPAWQVGGDFYDVFGSHGGPVSLVVADVAGKGLSAALLTSLLQGAIRAASWTSASEDEDYGEVMEHMNQLLCTRTAQERFASLFWCQYDPRTSILRYVNAGHLPPFVVRKSRGEFEILRLEDGGPVLGVIPYARYDQGRIRIESGDLLILYSDGITEAASPTDEDYGEERLIDSVRKQWELGPLDICQGVLADIRSFLGGRTPHDDQTLVIARLKATEQTKLPELEVASHAAG